MWHGNDTPEGGGGGGGQSQASFLSPAKVEALVKVKTESFRCQYLLNTFFS